MTAKESEVCPSCKGRLERLGSLKRGAEWVHFQCTKCRKKWLRHSERGWKETDVDLKAD